MEDLAVGSLILWWWSWPADEWQDDGSRFEELNPDCKLFVEAYNTH